MFVKSLIAFGAAAAVSGAAFHASLKSSLPAAGTTVTSPARISLTFTEPVRPAPISSIVILKADSTEVMKLAVTLKKGDATTLEGPVPTTLAPGKYIIRWKNGAADDGHVSRGVFGFTVVAGK